MPAREAVLPCARSLSAAVHSQLCVIVSFIMQHDGDSGNLLAAAGRDKAFHYYKAESESFRLSFVNYRDPVFREF